MTPLLDVLGDLVQTTAGTGSPSRLRAARTGTPSAQDKCSSAVKPA